MSKIIDAIPLPSVYYHTTDTSYWRGDEKGSWIKINETAAKNFIADQGYCKTATATGANSEVERCMMGVQSNHNVAYVGPLAGHAAGVRDMAGNLVLVTTGPNLIEAKAGSWPTLDKLFASLFVDGELDQRPYFYGWLKSARDSLKHSRWKASQLLAMAGPVGSGKSLTQNLITEMLGGRSTKPYQFMMGQTAFNSHMFRGEHQMLEDENESICHSTSSHTESREKFFSTFFSANCKARHQSKIAFSFSGLIAARLFLNFQGC